MADIALLLDPLHHGWMMLCPCGCKEIRPANQEAWHDFEVVPLSRIRLQIACLSCGCQTEVDMSTAIQASCEQAGSD